MVEVQKMQEQFSARTFCINIAAPAHPYAHGIPYILYIQKRQLIIAAFFRFSHYILTDIPLKSEGKQ
jgi:hypothetical protein